MTLLQKYFEDGWLKYGNSLITPKDRLDVGNRFYEDFYFGGIVNLKIPDLLKPRVDGGNSKDTPEKVLDARNRFNKAFLSLSSEQGYILWNIICLDKPVHLVRNKDYRHGIEVLKEEICKSLDCLFYHYYGKPKTSKYHSIVSWIDERCIEVFNQWMEEITSR